MDKRIKIAKWVKESVKNIKEAGIVDKMVDLFAPSLPMTMVDKKFVVDKKEIKDRVKEELGVEVSDADINKLIDKVGSKKADDSLKIPKSPIQKVFADAVNNYNKESEIEDISLPGLKMYYFHDPYTVSVDDALLEVLNGDSMLTGLYDEIHEALDAAGYYLENQNGIDFIFVNKETGTRDGLGDKEAAVEPSSLDFESRILYELAANVDCSDAGEVAKYFYNDDYLQMIEDNEFTADNCREDIDSNTDSYKDQILSYADMDEEDLEDFMLKEKMEEEDEALQEIFSNVYDKVRGNRNRAMFEFYSEGGRYRDQDKEYVENFFRNGGYKGTHRNSYFTNKDLQAQVVGKYADEDLANALLENASTRTLSGIVEDIYEDYPAEEVAEFVEDHGLTIDAPEIMKTIEEGRKKIKEEQTKAEQARIQQETLKKKQEAEKYLESLSPEVRKHLEDKLKGGK